MGEGVTAAVAPGAEVSGGSSEGLGFVELSQESWHRRGKFRWLTRGLTGGCGTFLSKPDG